MRELKFRAWDKIEQKMWIPALYKGEQYAYNGMGGLICMNGELADPIMQYTGLKDKNGACIFEGDILRIRMPMRTTQTHTGDNIPLGRYTEPLDPAITENVCSVVFKDAAFRVDSEDDGYDGYDLLDWVRISFDLDNAKDGFLSNWSHYGEGGCFKWDDEEEGDLQYLLAEYDLDSEEDLLNYLGAEIIGNIHETPELLGKE